MKKIFLMLVVFLFSFNILADTVVKGYYRKSGTFVHSYHRDGANNKAKGIKVKGYYRKSGTYVRPYQRSNSQKSHGQQIMKAIMNPS